MSEQTHWAIDLGTTNTLIARWSGTHAETVALDRICQYEPAWQTPLVPSAIFFESPTTGYIGHRAIAAEEVMRSTYSGRLTPIARAFKKTLAKSSSQAVAELDHQPISARQCAKVFLGELLRETAAREHDLNRTHISKWNFPRRFVAWARREGLVNDLTMTVPVESFEAYRMELNNIARGLGVQRFKVIDEPVAAALGYGVDLTEDRYLLVVDFGGGTLDIAIVRTNLAQTTDRQRNVSHRRAELIAARGLNLGGETVDEWVTELACSKIKTHADQMFGYIRAQAENVKKELSGKVLTTDQTYFRLPGLEPLMISRQEFLDALTQHDLYELLQRVTEATLEDAQHRVNIHEIDAVLLVGGSTLLPGVRELYEKMFDAPRVHYWEPFEAVVKGAAIYGAGYFVDQIIHHDYAIKVFNDEKQSTDFELLVRRGTPYPTPAGSQSRYYAVAQGQLNFSVPVCEVGYAGRLSLGWQRRGNGNDYWTPKEGEESECVVGLNEGDSIQLKLPGQSGNRARLRIDFNIDEERHLVASIFDILRDKEIRSERVTRLR